MQGSGFRVWGSRFGFGGGGGRGSGFRIPGCGLNLGVAVVEAVKDIALEQLLVRDPDLHRVARRTVLLRPGLHVCRVPGLGVRRTPTLEACTMTG